MTRGGGQLAEGVDEGELAELAANVAAANEVADRAAEGAIDRTRAAAGTRDALEEVDDDGVCLERGDVAGLDFDLHEVPAW